MQVFKCAMQIAWRNIAYLLIYAVGMSFVGVGMALAFDFNPTDTYERERLDYALIDRDNSEVSQAIIDFLALYGDRVDVADQPEALQDAVAKNAVEYVLIVPDGYGASFEEVVRNGGEDADLPEMEAAYSYLEATGTMLDANLDNYMGMLASALAVDPNASFADAVSVALDAAAEQVDVEVVSSAIPSWASDSFTFYLMFSSYGIFAGVIACVGIVISTMRRSGLRLRQECSPLTSWATNAQIALASLVIMLFVCIWTFALGLVVFWDAASAEGVTALALKELSLFSFALVPLGIAFFVGTLGIGAGMANAVGNIAGLIVSFMGGAWISFDLMGETVRSIAMLLPGIWYTESLNDAALASSSSSAFASYGCDLLVLILYAFVFMLLGLLAGRLRMRKRS